MTTKFKIEGDDLVMFEQPAGQGFTLWQVIFINFVADFIDRNRKNHKPENNENTDSMLSIVNNLQSNQEWIPLLDEWIKRNGGEDSPGFNNKFLDLLNVAFGKSKTIDELKDFLKTYKSPGELKKIGAERLDKQRIRGHKEVYFEEQDLDFFPAVMNAAAFDNTEIKRYPDQGNFTVICEKHLDKNKTLYLKFPEIPIELEGNVPHLTPMLFEVLINTVKIAMDLKRWSFSFRKTDQLDLMGRAATGEQFEQLTHFHQTWYYLDIGVKDKRSPGWEYHKRVYNSFEHLPGKEGFISVGLNPEAWPVLGRFFENTEKPPKPYKTLPDYLDLGVLNERQTRLIIYLRKHGGLGKKVYPHLLKTLFERMNIFYPDIESRGIPWAIKELEDCLKTAHEKNELLSWKYEPSKETLQITESVKALIKKESVASGGPLWLSERYKQIHAEFQDVVKSYKKKGIIIPKKIDPFDVFAQWKINLVLGDKRQEGIFEKEKGKFLEQLDHEKINEIVKWHERPEFNRKNTPEKTREYLENLVHAYGIDNVWDIYQTTKAGANSHPNDFWTRVKMYAKKRSGTGKRVEDFSVLEMAKKLSR